MVNIRPELEALLSLTGALAPFGPFGPTVNPTPSLGYPAGPALRAALGRFKPATETELEYWSALWAITGREDYAAETPGEHLAVRTLEYRVYLEAGFPPTDLDKFYPDVTGVDPVRFPTLGGA